MGSAGALLSHPPPQLGSILLRRHHISLPHLSSYMPEPLHCRRRHLRCSAVEGSSSQDTNLPASQREESPSSSLGATLQDPLPGRGTPLASSCAFLVYCSVEISEASELYYS
uniref:Uncharacterized protein n=1 Tax=Aegilops tauschii subsp. strangulata TaxID=200361 RepID=A0A453ETT5_AEGTS